MHMNKLWLALLLACAVSLSVVLRSSDAAPVASSASAVTTAAKETNMTVPVHGCHRFCALGPAGWHRHVGPYCRRVPC